jgi:hypothetical protein
MNSPYPKLDSLFPFFFFMSPNFLSFSIKLLLLFIYLFIYLFRSSYYYFLKKQYNGIKREIEIESGNEIKENERIQITPSHTFTFSKFGI